MNARSLLLVFLLCIAAVPGMALAADDYAGGTIQLGGSGTQITMVTTIAATSAAETVPPMVPAAVGALSVTTTPAGASILIDGVERGISPATIRDLSVGSHTLLLKLEGFKDLSAPVTIIAGQTQTSTSTLFPTDTPLPALPTRSPGFGVVLGIAALGTAILVKKTFL